MYIKRAVLWILVFVCAATIFLLSNQPASESNQVSQSVSQSIVSLSPTIRTMPQEEKEPLLKQWNHWVRKFAHFFLFFLLGKFVLWLMLSYQFHLKRSWMITLFACLLYAVSDEVHQLFVSGRGSQLIDVLIDFCGVLMGSYFAACISSRAWLCGRIKSDKFIKGKEGV